MNILNLFLKITIRRYFMYRLYASIDMLPLPLIIYSIFIFLVFAALISIIILCWKNILKKK